MKWSEKQKDWMQEQIERDIAYKLAYQETGEPTMTEYIRVRKDEYDELVDIKSKVEILKDIYLPDDVKFVLLTKNDYVRNRVEPLQKKIDDLKEWLEERIITIEDTPTYTFVGSLGKEIRVNDEIVKELVEVLERLSDGNE